MLNSSNSIIKPPAHVQVHGQSTNTGVCRTDIVRAKILRVWIMKMLH